MSVCTLRSDAVPARRQRDAAYQSCGSMRVWTRSRGSRSTGWVDRCSGWTLGGGKIEAARADGSHRKILVNTSLEQPRAIVVHPRQGWVTGGGYWVGVSSGGGGFISIHFSVFTSNSLEFFGAKFVVPDFFVRCLHVLCNVMECMFSSKSVHQSVCLSIEQYINQSINQSFHKIFHQSIY